MKKWIVCLVLVLSLVACGGEETPAEPESNTTSNESNTNTTTTNNTAENETTQNDIGIGSDVGGTVERAAIIGINQTYEATIGNSEDIDAYRLFLDPGMHLMLEVYVTGNTSVFAELVTENGIVLDSVFPAGGETATIDYQFNNRAEASYVVRFSADDMSTYSFTANAEKQMEGSSEGDAGDTHADATLIEANNNYAGSLNDEDGRDYYYFTPVAGQPFSVELTVAENSTSVMAELQIIDSIAETSAFPAGGETAVLTIDSATGDTYVLALSSDGSSDYSFVLQGQTDSAGNANGSTQFTGSASFTLNQLNFAEGEAIEISISVSGELSTDAWIGIVPSETPHGDEIENDFVDVTYEYLINAVDGNITLYAPTVAGQYDVRLFSSDNGGIELASVSIGVGSVEPMSGGEGGTTTPDESDENTSDSDTDVEEGEETSSANGNDSCVVGTWRVANFSEYLVAMVQDSMDGQSLEISATDSGSLLLSFDGEIMTMSEENFQVTMSLLGQTVPTAVDATGTANYTANGSIITGTTNEAVVSAENGQQVSFNISNVVGEQVSYTCEGDTMIWSDPFASPIMFEKIN